MSPLKKVKIIFHEKGAGNTYLLMIVEETNNYVKKLKLKNYIFWVDFLLQNEFFFWKDKTIFFC